MFSPSFVRARGLVALLLLGSVVLTACGGDGDVSVRAEGDPTTTSSTEATTTTSTTTATTVPTAADGQDVTFRGLTVTVPADWPVHDLVEKPNTCVRLDEHAAFVGPPGPEPNCPAHVIGHTETVWLLPLNDPEQIDAARATQATTVNGIAVRIDPDPDSNGSLTVVFPAQRVLAILSYGDGRAVVDAILASVRLAG